MWVGVTVVISQAWNLYSYIKQYRARIFRAMRQILKIDNLLENYAGTDDWQRRYIRGRRSYVSHQQAEKYVPRGKTIVATECITLQARYRTNRGRYNRVQRCVCLSVRPSIHINQSIYLSIYLIYLDRHLFGFHALFAYSRKAPIIFVMSVCSVHTGRISVNFDIGDSRKICRENSNLVKIGQKYRRHFT